MSNFNAKLRELLDDESDSMTAWEVEFIESLDSQSDRSNFYPSFKQEQTLDRIWNKVFK